MAQGHAAVLWKRKEGILAPHGKPLPLGGADSDLLENSSPGVGGGPNPVRLCLSWSQVVVLQ